MFGGSPNSRKIIDIFLKSRVLHPSVPKARPFAVVPIEELGAATAVGFMIRSLFSWRQTSFLNPIKASTERSGVKRKAGLMLPNARNPSFPNHLMCKDIFS